MVFSEQTARCLLSVRIPCLLASEETARREQCLISVGGAAQFCLMDSSGLVTVVRGHTGQRWCCNTWNT